MASSRVVSRLLAPRNLHRLSMNGGPARYFWHHHHQHRRNLPETNFGTMTNIFERWEKEFDRMQQQFNNFFQDLKSNRTVSSQTPSEVDMILTESDGSKRFHLSLNVHGFEPAEIKIKTQDGTITISAKKEKKANNNYSLHEFSQTYTLPEEVKLDDLKSTYTENGILSITAPLSPKDPPKDRQIKIERAK